MSSISRGIQFAALAALSAVTLAVAVQAAPTSIASAHSVGVHSVAAPPIGAGKASVKLVACTGAARYDGRRLEFKSTMNSLGAGGKMEMRFTLYRRYYESRRFSIVKAPSGSGLNEWLGSSDSAATTYIHSLAVTPVETHALYRVKLRYRWLNAGGKVVASAKRSSRLCNQKRKLPNLLVTSAKRYPNSGTIHPELPAVYEVTISNSGSSSASIPLGQLLAAQAGNAGLIDGTVDTLPLGELDTIPALGSIVRLLYGPECSRVVLAIKVDPARQVRETNRGDNDYTENC